MRRTPWRAVPLVLILGLALVSCDGPNRGTSTQPSAASGFQVVVTASPNVLRPGGTAVITVKVFDTQGRLVDGAPVVVTSSSAKEDKGVAIGTTTRGVFIATFQIAQPSEGVAPATVIITATSEDAFATALITVTAGV